MIEWADSRESKKPTPLWKRLLFWILAAPFFIPLVLFGFSLLVTAGIVRAKNHCERLVRGDLAVRRSRPGPPNHHTVSGPEHEGS